MSQWSPFLRGLDHVLPRSFSSLSSFQKAASCGPNTCALWFCISNRRDQLPNLKCWGASQPSSGSGISFYASQNQDAKVLHLSIVIHSVKESLLWLLNAFHKIYVCFCWMHFMDNCKMSVGNSYRACNSKELSHCYPWSANEVKMCWMLILSWGYTYYACYRCTMLICFLGKLCSICIILTSWNLQTSGKSVCFSAYSIKSLNIKESI